MTMKYHPTIEFFNNLFFEDEEGSENRINLRFLSQNKPVINNFIPLEQIINIPKILKQHKKYDAYFQVAKCNGKGGKGSIVEISALWVDWDSKEKSINEVDNIPFPLKPSVIINSGGGKHLYWFLNEPAKKEDIPFIENILKRLAQVYDGDSSAAEAARILRLPGTLNHKYNPPHKVTIETFKPERSYNLSEFDELLPPLRELQRNHNAYEWEKSLIEDGVAEGERNYTIARLAGRYVNKGLSHHEIMPILLHANKQFRPPLDYKEIEKTLISVQQTHAKNHPQEELTLDGVYSGWAGQYSEVMSKTLESPRSFWFFSALTCLGTLFSGKATLGTEIRPQPRLFTLLLGESAWERKSTAIALTTKFFQETISDFPFCWGVGSAEGLADSLKADNRLLLVHDEFKAFVGKSKIQGSVLLPVVNTLFESNLYQSSTKGHRIHIENAHLSMLAASTVETYQTIFDANFLDIGFVNRLFVVRDRGGRKWAIPPEIDKAERERLKRHLGELLQVISNASNGGPNVISIEQKARELFESWYRNELIDSIHAKRLDNYGLRLMVLITINEGKTEVDLDTARKVIKILNWEFQIRKQVDPIDAEGQIARMEERIRRIVGEKREGISDRDLKRAVHYDRYGLFVYNSALKNMLQYREMRLDHKTKLYFPKRK